MESILTSMKKLLGVQQDCDHFDVDIIMHINTVFSDLNQLGVGPSEGFKIEDELAIWEDYIPEDDLRFENIKSYMYFRLKLMFDPPLSSAVIASIERSIEKLEWRITNAAETN